jgi:adenylate cyclase class IV
MIEVELKFAVPGYLRSSLQARLAALPSLQQFAPKENVDTYYDTADFTCLQQAVFFRIRNQAHLEIKYHELADPTHMHASEHVFPLSAEPSGMREFNTFCSRFIPYWHEAATIEAALATNGLTPFVHIEKQRALSVYEQFHLCLDHVAGLGTFLEVETLCTQDEIEQAQTQLQAFVSSLDFPALQPVKIGYVELWLRSHLPHVYHLGTYQTEIVDAQSDACVLPVSTHVPMHRELLYAQEHE